MSETTKFPRTNLELAELAGGEAVRFEATEEEYWNLAEEAEYRVDFFNNEIIAAMSYESEIHSDIVNNLMFLLQTIFRGQNVRFGNSNRPVCIPGCNNAVFNPDGSVIRLPAEFYQYRPGMTAELTPLNIFEVLSDSTRVRDWGEKLPCYKRIPTLQQILYIDSEQPRIIVLDRLPESGKWLESSYEHADDSFAVGGKSISLREIYAGTLIK
jgi:Uma2 family endonuclease